MRTGLRILKLSLVTILTTGLWSTSSQAQTPSQSQMPEPTGQMSDFAGVMSAQTKDRIEIVLQNLKLRSKIVFYVATVDNTGTQDIFDFSRDLARTWNIGYRNSSTKSLLLVVCVNSKNSFTQFSRLVQDELPDGILGEMSQRMRGLLATNQFADAIENGVQAFVNSLAQKLGFSAVDIDKPTVTADSSGGAPAAESTPQITPVTLSEQRQTRRRIASEPAERANKQSPATKTAAPAPTEIVTPANVEAAVPTKVETAAPTNTETSATVEGAAKAQANETVPSPNTKSGTPAKSKSAKAKAAKNGTPVKGAPSKTAAAPKRTQAQIAEDDADEAEAVELTLTKPLAQRPALLKEFLQTHPNSKSKARAVELLISTYAALGDEQLKNGDVAGGIQQLMLVIDQADASISDKLFTGVVAQIPLNLYLRGERTAAFDAAQKLETKFGSDPKRLLQLAGFYLNIERGDEVARLASQAAKLAPDMAEAHRLLAVGLHISLKVDEAVVEYKRALELDPNSMTSRGSLADLYRGVGKNDEAFALYQEQLKSDPKDRASRTGMVLSLYELGRKDEANNLLDQTLAEDPRNLPLLTGAAYWFAAHENYDRAFELAQKAVAIEPRYTWAQIALSRSLLGLKRPLDAERAIRFARQYGKFPTLSYELANVLSAMGLYEEAVDALRESFVIKDSEIEAQLAGRVPAVNANFIDLLAPERTASIYQTTPADTAGNAKTLKDLLTFASVLHTPDGEKIDESRAESAAREFAQGDDSLRAFRQVYAASRLLKNNVGFQTAFELAEEAKKNVDQALDSSVATIAVQADEFRELRARAITAGNVPDVAPAPRNVVANIFNGRIEDVSGWALFNQEKLPDAVVRLRTAVSVLPIGTPSWRTALWHLGVALEQSGNGEEALGNYIKSYTSGEPDPVRRTTIERLYRKLNGSLDGLDEKIGSPGGVGSVTMPAVSSEPGINKPVPATEATTPTTSETSPVTTQKPPTSEPSPTETSKPDTNDPKVPEPSAKAESSSTPTPEATPLPSPGPATSSAPAPKEPAPMSDESLRAASARLRSSVKITGRVLDENKNGVANVVVVLISPSGSVLAATTDTEGKYSFTVAASQKTYRVIPSKDGYTFVPLDRSLPALFEDQTAVDFVGSIKTGP